MADHLPECLPVYQVTVGCICPDLRACEQRVRDEERTGAPVAMSELAGYSRGYVAGVKAARDAVAGLIHSVMCDCESCWWKADCLDAIDGLMKEKS